MIIPILEKMRGAAVAADGTPARTAGEILGDANHPARLCATVIVKGGTSDPAEVGSVAGTLSGRAAAPGLWWVMPRCDPDPEAEEAAAEAGERPPYPGPSIDALRGVIGAGASAVAVCADTAVRLLGVRGIPLPDDDDYGPFEHTDPAPDGPAALHRDQLVLTVPSLEEVAAIEDAALASFRAVLVTGRGAREGRVAADVARRFRDARCRLVLVATSLEEAENVARHYHALAVDVAVNAAAGSKFSPADVASRFGRAAHVCCGAADDEAAPVPAILVNPEGVALGVVPSTTRAACAEAFVTARVSTGECDASWSILAAGPDSEGNAIRFVVDGPMGGAGSAPRPWVNARGSSAFSF